jgi:AcrR family transcriptional regulator
MKLQKPKDLREACVTEALAIIGEAGVERLSIREVARRLGVSHQAPYKHFASSEHLLAELVRRTYAAFADHLENRPRGDSPGDDMECMGRAYFRFAMDQPLKYRLLFGTPLPDPSQHPAMMEEARKAFTVLLAGVAKMRGGGPLGLGDRELQLDAMFVWSVVHGMASIMQTAALHQLGLDEATLGAALPHALESIGRALTRGSVPSTPAGGAKAPAAKPVRKGTRS